MQSKRSLIYFLSLMILILFTVGTVPIAHSAVRICPRPVCVVGAIDLTGGLPDDLDSIDGARLAAGDYAFVVTTANTYFYKLQDGGCEGESVPDTIIPDYNPGSKCWVKTNEFTNIEDLQNVTGVGTDAQVLVSDGTDLNPVTFSGDATVTNAGVITVVDNYVLNTGDTINGDLEIKVKQLEIVSTLTVNGLGNFVRDGNIIYASMNQAHSLMTIDITDKTNPIEVCRITSGHISNPHGIARKGNYLFTTNVGLANSVGILKISNHKCPVVIGSFANANIAHPYNISIFGNVMAISNLDNASIVFLNISNPEDIRYLGKVTDATLLDTPYYLYCTSDKFCYSGSEGQAIDYFVKIDATDPTSPKIVASLQVDNILNDIAMDHPTCDDQGCFVSGFDDNAISYIDTHTMTITDTLIDVTYFDSPNTMILAGDYLYVGNEIENITVLNVADRSNIFIDSILSSNAYFELLHNLDFYGQYIIAIASRTTGGGLGSNTLTILKQTALIATHADIGALQATNISVDQSMRIGQNLKLGGSSDIGGGLSVEQDFSAGQGFSVRKHYGFDTPSLSYDEATNRQAVWTFHVFKEKLYAPIQGWDAGLGDMQICCSDTNGAVWTTYDGAENALAGIETYQDVLYVGQGKGTEDGDIFFCDDPSDAGLPLICEAAGDWGLSYDGTYDFVNVLITYKAFLYSGMGNDVDEGDVLICNPTTAGASAEICDHNSDWTISRDASTLNNATNIETMAIHNGVLYIGLNGSTELIAYCSETKCDATEDWNDAATAANAPFSGSYAATKHLISYGGILYAGMGTGVNDGDIFVCSEITCDNEDDWSLLYDGTASEITSFYVYNGILLFGDETGNVYRINGTKAPSVVISDPNAYDRVVMGSYKGQLYLGYGYDANKSDIWTLPTFAGKITSINSDTTEGNSIASIVDYVQLTGQTTSISTTNLFSPPSDGLFRINAYINCTETEAQSITALIIGWTDSEGTAQTLDIVGTNVDCTNKAIAAARGAFTTVIQAQAIAPITYATTVGGGNPTHDIHITTERLN